VIDRERASSARGSGGVTCALLWLLLSASACTTAPRRAAQAGEGAGAGGPPAGVDASTTAGNAAAAGESAGAGAGGAGGGGGSASDSAGADATVPNVLDGSALQAGGAGGAPGPSDASGSPVDATWTDGPPAPGCPPLLPAFDEYCNREGLSCSYGMECCPDLAFCEYGRWTLLTHHCDTCP
jgi:hypothetical protein